MNLLRRAFSSLRTWLGLGDASDDHLTPSHGWLLPSAETVIKLRKGAAVTPAKPPLR